MFNMVGLLDPVHRGSDAMSGDGGSVVDLAQRKPCSGFTGRDMADLERWSIDNRRVAICTSEMGTFAMLYHEGLHWASWGVVRQDRHVLLWDCVTLSDLGRFASMADALAEVRLDDEPEPHSNVILFAAAAQRLRPTG